MKQSKLWLAKEEAERFIALVTNLLADAPDTYEVCGNKKSGAVRRSSMDLTRALAELRRH